VGQSLRPRQPVIGNAVRRQLETLEHVMLAGFTHEPVVELSERLVAATPAGLERCFYADNGSSAVEVALKMSFHYWLNQGEPKRRRFVALENSYHGETLGALAVGDVALYKETYQPLLMECLLAPSPDAYLREAARARPTTAAGAPPSSRPCSSSTPARSAR
jgi:adenosylmethionine---8-amino-7-oxononanoate aminotransferase